MAGVQSAIAENIGEEKRRKKEEKIIRAAKYNGLLIYGRS